MKRLALFLDGTWNNVSSNTNVWRMKALCNLIDRNGVEQRLYYDEGVAGFRGGGFGEGLGKNVLQAYQWVVENFRKGTVNWIIINNENYNRLVKDTSDTCRKACHVIHPTIRIASTMRLREILWRSRSQSLKLDTMLRSGTSGIEAPSKVRRQHYRTLVTEVLRCC